MTHRMAVDFRTMIQQTNGNDVTTCLLACLLGVMLCDELFANPIRASSDRRCLFGT
jgi:hypothetical protein